jgi:PKD repeat protein
MANRTRSRHLRHRLAAVATATLLVLAAPLAGAPSASAQSGPVPNFNSKPLCVIDILAISCFMEGSATGGSRIVSWDWEYPGAFGNEASGQFPTLRFETTGTFEVTLTVTDSQNRTGSVTKQTVVAIGA